MVTAFADISQTISMWRIWTLMGRQDISLRYRRSGIGAFWISISLVLFILTLSYLYAEIFKQPHKDYLTYIAGGLLAWNFISIVLVEACGVVVDGEAHLRNIPLPIGVLSARMVFRNAIIFAHNLLAVAVVLVIFGVSFTWYWLYLPLGFVALAATGFFLGLILGPICARFRDIGQLTANLTQILFFLTPIMWMPQLVSTSRGFVAGNPLYNLIELVRAPILGQAPTALNWQISLALISFLAIGAILVIGYARKRLYFWL